MVLNKRETAQVLAALRYWQRMSKVRASTGERPPEELPGIEDIFDSIPPMDEGEIDHLCERINYDD